jgi:ribosomal protein L37E
MLMQNPMSQGGEDEFVECRRCNKFIPRSAVRCGFCGYPRLLRRRLRWLAGGVVAVAALVAGIVGAGRLLDNGPTSIAEQPPPTGVPLDTQPQSDQPTEPPTGEALVVEPRVQETVEPIPTRVAPDAVRPDSAPPRPQPPLPRPTITTSTVHRWALTWANLREGPGTGYAVVRVLEPGERIRVADLTRGFWAVYDNGNVEGYVANSVLSDRQLPPDSLPTSRSGTGARTSP